MAFDWELLRTNLEKTAEQLEVFSLRAEKNVLHLDLKASKRAKVLAKQCRRLKDRTLTWPGISRDAARGEAEVLWGLYVKLRREAADLLNSAPSNSPPSREVLPKLEPEEVHLGLRVAWTHHAFVDTNGKVWAANGEFTAGGQKQRLRETEHPDAERNIEVHGTVERVEGDTAEVWVDGVHWIVEVPLSKLRKCR